MSLGREKSAPRRELMHLQLYVVLTDIFRKLSLFSFDFDICYYYHLLDNIVNFHCRSSINIGESEVKKALNMRKNEQKCHKKSLPTLRAT